ncbi:MAG: AAA family ATPase [Vulcanimicrobiaceae bacterium]
MIVTISREYGAAGLAVSDGVASALGYELLADELPREVAARLGISPDEVAVRANAEPPLSERVLLDLGAGTPELLGGGAARSPQSFDESVRRELADAIRGRAERGRVVIVGRNAGAILGSRPDLVRVFLVAAREWRIARIAESFGRKPSEAASELDRIDAARKKLAADRFGLRWGDPHAYDLVLNVSRLGIPAAVAAVVAAVRERANP